MAAAALDLMGEPIAFERSSKLVGEHQQHSVLFFIEIVMPVGGPSGEHSDGILSDRQRQELGRDVRHSMRPEAGRRARVESPASRRPFGCAKLGRQGGGGNGTKSAARIGQQNRRHASDDRFDMPHRRSNEVFAAREVRQLAT